ncbi:MAG: hypothetical protein Kow00108_20410 [Calditrichia bacterium]
MLRRTLLLLLMAFGILFSQEMEQVIAHSDGENAYIFITYPLKSGEGALLMKQTGKKWIEAIPVPVRPLDDPYQLKTALGDDYIPIARTMETPDPNIILQRLKTDPVYSLLLCLRYPRLAVNLGRLIIDNKVKPGQTIQYKVVFVNDRNEVMRESKPFRVSIAKPAVREVDVATTKQMDRFLDIIFRYPKFSWDNPDPVVGFNIYRSTDGRVFNRVNTEMVFRLDEEEIKYQDGMLDYGEKYWYKITAVTYFGWESPGKVLPPVLLKDTEAPSKVPVVEARFVEKGILVSWKPVPETDVAGYLIFKGEKQEEVNQQITKSLISPFTLSFLDTVGTDGIKYFYAVVAVDKAGNKGPVSAKAFAVWPDKHPPQPPTGLKAVYNRKTHQVDLSWNSASREKLRGYYIYRGKDKEHFTQLTPRPVKTQYSDSGYGKLKFNSGADYWYGIKAVDMSWNLSDFAFTKVQIPDTIPPEPPTGLILDIRQNGDVVMNWNPSPSTDVVKYEVSIRRETDKDYTLLKTVGADTLWGFVPRLEKGITYGFRIRAIDKAGNISPKGLIKNEMVRDFSPPPHPRNVFYKKTENGYVLTWNKVVDFDLVGYVIYRAVSPTATYSKVFDKIIKETAITLPLDTPEGFYQVRSVDTSGNESRKNEVIHVHP